MADAAGSLESVPEPVLRAIEDHLHAIIRSRAPFTNEDAVLLPSLAAMLAGKASEGFRPTHGSADVWFFPVPGMYGGFRLCWLALGVEAKLEAVSFCRVAGGSGQRHEITATGGELVEWGMY